MVKKVKARKCTAEIVGNIQAKVETAHAYDFFSCHPNSQEQSPEEHQNACDKSSYFCWNGESHVVSNC
jgi:hypothetical protein